MQLGQSAVAMKTIPNEGNGHVEQVGQQAHYELRQTFAATCGGDAPHRHHQTNLREGNAHDENALLLERNVHTACAERCLSGIKPAGILSPVSSGWGVHTDCPRR